MNVRVTELDDEGAELSELGSDIKVCTLKIAGLKSEKVKYIAWYIRRHNIDVLFIQDTQLSETRTKRGLLHHQLCKGGQQYLHRSWRPNGDSHAKMGT